MPNLFSEKLKILREDKKISQELASKKLGISRGKLGHWETGRTEPNIDEIVRISNFYGCSLEYLMNHSIPKIPIVYNK